MWCWGWSGERLIPGDEAEVIARGGQDPGDAPEIRGPRLGTGDCGPVPSLPGLATQGISVSKGPLSRRPSVSKGPLSRKALCLEDPLSRRPSVSKTLCLEDPLSRRPSVSK